MVILFFFVSQSNDEFAEAIKANYIEFAFNNPLPHHLFLAPKEINELVLNP
jgi:hypothetical protein